MSRQELLGLLTTIRVNGHRVKFIFTSRPHVPCWKGAGVVQISLREDSVETDITAYINAEIRELNFPDDLSAQVRETLIRGAKGLFLWVSLILNDLKNSKITKPEIIKSKLKTLPRTFPDAYINILRKIPKENQEGARNILQWVVCAKRPLDLQELTIATALRTGVTSIAEIEDDMEQDMRSFIPRIFGPMLQIRENTVHLVHESVRDFLLRPAMANNENDPLCAFFELSPAKSHQTLAKHCLTYLFFDECASEAGREIDLGWSGMPPLMSYAIVHWPEHASQSYLEGVDDLELSKMYAKLAKSPRKLVRSPTRLAITRATATPSQASSLVHWTRVSRPNRYGSTTANRLNIQTTPLHLAAELGLYPLVKELLECGADVNRQASKYGTPLAAAAFTGNEAISKLLLEYGADSNMQGGEYCTDHNGTDVTHHARVPVRWFSASRWGLSVVPRENLERSQQSRLRTLPPSGVTRSSRTPPPLANRSVSSSRSKKRPYLYDRYSMAF